MKTTRAASTPKLDLANEATPPDLPAVFHEQPMPPAMVQRPLTAEALSEMLANRRKRHDGWTPIRVAAFIEHLAETTSVTKAADYAGVSVAACYHLRNHPDAQAFRDAWDNAVAARFEKLTDIAMERVEKGVERMRWIGDMVVGYDRIFSDRLLIHMLNRADPDRDRALPVHEGAPPRRAAGPASGSLPLAADFVVAAGTETGKLGWDPDHDDCALDPDIAADVAKIHAAQAERDAAAKAESAALTAGRAASNAAIDALEAFNRGADEAWDERHAALTSPSKSSSFDDEERPRRRRR